LGLSNAVQGIAVAADLGGEQSSMSDGLQVGSLRLTPACADRILPVPSHLAEALAPATHCFFEWTDYWVECPGADQLRAGNAWAERLSAQLFRVRFENRLGLAALQPFAGGQPVGEPVHVEVLSAKFPTPEEHLGLFRTLLDNLFTRAARLPFTFSAPTARGVVESLRPPTPLFVLHFLTQHGRELAMSLATVQGSPHRKLVDRPEYVPVAEASEVDADVLLRLLQDTHRWAPASGFPLAERLNGHAPTHVWQRLPEETYDTTENRFGRSFLRQVLVAAETLPAQRWWANVPNDRKHDVRNTAAHVRRAMHCPPFADVGEMERFPASSQVLLRREGYRDLLRLWQLFHQARRPLFERLRQAMDVRDIATLYEVWVFLALVEETAEITGESPVVELRLSDHHGLNWYSEARFGRAGKLLYNRGYLRPTSYSVPLRPDFTWEVSGRPEVVLDAKFRLDRGDLDADGEDTPQATAKRADLYKMHTYRDALGVRAAVAVYPGEAAVFYDCNAGRLPDASLKELLRQERQGIGAIPMCPGHPNEET
jgi:predicted component of viral defense system (DUF524 family)